MRRNRWLSIVSASLLSLSFGSLLRVSGPIGNQPSSVAVGTSIWHNGSFPVENFQGYTSPFGYRSSPTGGYSTEFHTGLDFAAPTGSYIRSWWSGKVISVSDKHRLWALL